MNQANELNILTLATRLAKFGDDTLETIKRELTAPETMDVSVHRRLQEVAESMEADVAAGQDAVEGFDDLLQLIDAILKQCPWTFHPDYGQVKKDSVKALDELERQLPPWATGHAKSFTDVGAQLCTRDGRRMGNAVLYNAEATPVFGRQVFNVVTDVGNLVRFTETELQSAFYEPRYILNLDDHPGIAIMKARTGQEVKAKLGDIASEIMEHAVKNERGTTAVISTTVNCIVNLSFDPKEQITPETLNKALAQNFLRLATDLGDELQVESAEMIELLHE